MQQEMSDKLINSKRHNLLLVVIFVITPLERYLVTLNAYDAVIG